MREQTINPFREFLVRCHGLAKANFDIDLQPPGAAISEDMEDFDISDPYDVEFMYQGLNKCYTGFFGLSIGKLMHAVITHKDMSTNGKWEWSDEAENTFVPVLEVPEGYMGDLQPGAIEYKPYPRHLMYSIKGSNPMD